MLPPYWADGSTWHQVDSPQHSSSFLPTMSSSQPPFVLPILACYFYHRKKKKVMLFLCILPWNSHTSSLEKAPTRWLWSLGLRETANLPGCRQVIKMSCIMQEEWFQTPWFRMEFKSWLWFGCIIPSKWLAPSEAFGGWKGILQRPCLGCQGKKAAPGKCRPSSTTHFSGRENQEKWAGAHAKLTAILQLGTPSCLVPGFIPKPMEKL